MCRLSLAWVTSENSTSNSNADNWRLFFTGPYLVSYCLWSPVLTAPPWFHANSLLFASLLSSRQLPSAGSRRQLPFASPYHFQIRRDFMSKNPLSGFAPKQTRLLWRPTHIVLHYHLRITILWRLLRKKKKQKTFEF